MAYWPFPGGLSGVDKIFFQDQIDAFLFEAYLESSFFTDLIGSNHNKPIYEKAILPGQGYAVDFGRRQADNYKNPILDQDQVKGVTDTGQIDSCVLPAHKITFKRDTRDVSVLEDATVIGLTEGEARRLAERHRQYRDYLTFMNATVSLYNVGVNGSMPRASRAVAGNLVNGQAADGVYVYQAGQMLPAVLETAMPTARKVQHGMSVAHILRLRALAMNAYVEDAIHPADILMVNGFESPEYWLFMNTAAAAALEKDTLFQTLYSARGVNLGPKQPNMNGGAHYLGDVKGVRCVEVPFMDDPDLAISSTNNPVCWSLFFGASAWGIFWKKKLYFFEKKDEQEDSMVQLARQHMGVGPLLFPSKTKLGYNTEQGLIHSFTINS